MFRGGGNDEVWWPVKGLENGMLRKKWTALAGREENAVGLLRRHLGFHEFWRLIFLTCPETHRAGTVELVSGGWMVNGLSKVTVCRGCARTKWWSLGSSLQQPQNTPHSERTHLWLASELFIPRNWSGNFLIWAPRSPWWGSCLFNSRRREHGCMLCMANSVHFHFVRHSYTGAKCLRADLKSPLNKGYGQCNKEGNLPIFKTFSASCSHHRSSAFQNRDRIFFFFCNFDSHVSQHTVSHLLPISWGCRVYASGMQTLPLRIIAKKGKQLAPEGKWVSCSLSVVGSGMELCSWMLACPCTVSLIQSPVLKNQSQWCTLSKTNSNNLGTNMEKGVMEKDQAVDASLSLAHIGHILIL